MSTTEREIGKNQKKSYLKAMPLRDLSDVEVIKHELKMGNIIILKITPLARKSIDDVKVAVNELSVFIKSIEGDIASLGEERVVIVPKEVRIWRPETVVSEKAPTAA
ncbi:MAG: cell division protein SepF [Candidatus Bathyarchaeota archaeon]|nr:cell division protein SepF [Candidatus Bathyarchaeum tardum]WGM89240.1 MAG: cell division protein SepF [Candidatus Bathyarchaeum tardum]